MKKRTYFAWWNIFFILFLNGVISLIAYVFIKEMNLIFTSIALMAFDLYAFIVFFIRMCFGKIVIEENKITIYKTGFYPECKGIRKIRKKVCFHFKDIIHIDEINCRHMFGRLRYLSITLSTNRNYRFFLFGFSQFDIVYTTKKYYKFYQKVVKKIEQEKL